MKKFNVPARKYCSGKKKMISLRLHEILMKEIESLAIARGWSVTDVVSTVLDQYVQFEDKKKNKD